MKRIFLSLAAIIFAVTAHAGTPRFLMQGHSLQGSEERHRRTIDLVAKLGIDSMRDECHWSNVEREKGKLTISDNVLKNLAYSSSKGIETVLILNYSNSLYDAGMAPHTPESRAAFSKYCEFMARELKDRVTYFEIWNEPNLDGFWPPKANAEDYTALLLSAYPAVKRGNSDAVVIGGSFSGIPFDYLQAMLDEGAMKGMEALSIHPYSSPASPEAANIFAKMKTARDMTAEHGAALPIWVTEYGFPTSEGGGVTEQYQANMIARSYILAQTKDWMPVFGWYWFGPDGPDAAWTEDRFGLVRQDWSLKPSYFALQRVIQMLKETEYVESQQPGALEAHIFRLNDDHRDAQSFDHVAVLWSPGTTRQVKAATEMPARVITVQGEPLDLSPLGGVVVLDLCDEPIYLLTKGIPQIEPFAPELVSFQKRPYPLTMSTQRPLFFERKPAEGMQARWILDKEAPFSLWRDDEGDLFARPQAGARRGEHILAAALFDNSGNPFGRLIARADVIDPVTIHFKPLTGTNSPRFNVIVSRTQDDVVMKGKLTLAAANDIVIQPATFDIDAETSATHTVAIITAEVPDTIYWLTARMEMDNGDRVEAKDHISLMTSPKVQAPITIDGKLNDWAKWPAIVINRREQLSGELRKWDGPEDASARIWTAWDEDWFYVAAEVTDDELSDPAAGFSVYNNDGIELYFDADHDGDRGGIRYSADDNQYGFFMEQGRDVVYAWSHLNSYSPGGKVSINRQPTEADTLTGAKIAYVIEGAVPMTEINLKPRPGMQIGFSVGLTDDDDPKTIHPFGQEVQLTWTGLRGAWQNPTKMADLFLVLP